ncbi:d732e54c-0179-4cfe-9f0f-322c54f9b763 [Thermothielavioides terrestris]|jgi:hypothetical protein|uniref:D732e54c-0179-4cfe-9f0f-322c54f9b763 n=1 Tax=Thermothielavioides terrestris TaxID=2587410 RepID=A0A446BLH8_9PEZI|nr:d732e54c-0179-4cfe-9f0f-322c54f9b763 [Thermothielavioides terrestris]
MECTRPSDVLSYLLLGFNVLSFQAHLTSRFTPAFSRNLAEKLPQHNRVLFWWAGLSDSALRAFFCGLNALDVFLLWSPASRPLGLKLALAGLCVGFYSDLKLGESPVPHLLLFALVGGALWLS